MAEMAVAVSSREIKAKQIKKQKYDKNAKEKSFELGRFSFSQKTWSYHKLGTHWEGFIMSRVALFCIILHIVARSQVQ